MKLTGKEQHILICIYRYKIRMVKESMQNKPLRYMSRRSLFPPPRSRGGRGGTYVKEKGGPKESMQNKSPRIHGQE